MARDRLEEMHFCIPWKGANESAIVSIEPTEVHTAHTDLRQVGCRLSKRACVKVAEARSNKIKKISPSSRVTSRQLEEKREKALLFIRIA
ncbi:hypothetical protein M514_02591 [Trichuris suis]|uniref:Uncharacterized protein n=1 Tax=Trichuris suis TaxID=68888 RepID=A0A085NNH0_9BILA|nr:hypothetical protein M513_02591 [Trichuris suis]KFD71016.1 hypothetical protein M514_02591 [Trichuris suis]